MSHRPVRHRLGAVVPVLATAALAAAAAPPASAAESATLDLQCALPGLGVQPVHVALSPNLPSKAILSGGLPTSADGSVDITFPAAFRTSIDQARLDGFGLTSDVDLDYGIGGLGDLASQNPAPVLSPASTRVDATAPLESALASSGDFTVHVPTRDWPGFNGGTFATPTNIEMRIAQRPLSAPSGGGVSLFAAFTQDANGNPIDPTDRIPCAKSASAGVLWAAKILYFGPPFRFESVSIGGVASTTATVFWSASPGASADVVRVTLTDTTSGESRPVQTLAITDGHVTLTGLTPGHAYSVKVIAALTETAVRVGFDWNNSDPPLTFTTTTAFPQAWTLTGTMKGPRGILPLKGSLTGFDLAASSGASGALTFAPTTGKVTSSGVPISVGVQPVAVGAATGGQANGVATVNQSLKLRLLQARVLGIPLVSTTTCATPATSLTLSGPASTTAVSLTGTATFAKVASCGSLTAFVAPLLAGSTSFALALAPQAPAAT